MNSRKWRKDRVAILAIAGITTVSLGFAGVNHAAE